MLLRTSIKKNLYYEIKERIDEEQFDGVHAVRKRTRKCKVYGGTSSKKTRNELIELLHQRVQHHRDKFATKDIYDELCTMVVKPNGKIEHADDAHDDLVFSYLWAMYVFYHGEDLATRFHLLKTEIYTDDHYDETSYSLEEEYSEGEQIDPSVFRDFDDEYSKIVDSQMKVIAKNKSITMEDLYKKQLDEEAKALDNIKKTRAGREAVAKAYKTPIDHLEKESQLGYVDIGNDINSIWYGDDAKVVIDPKLVGNLSELFNKVR